MTTILADAQARVMVADSRCTCGDTWHPMSKIHRVGDALIACAGDVKQSADFLRWHRGGRRGARPKGEDYTALILRPDGVWQFDSNGCEMRVERGFHALGSGAGPALGAMMAGASARRAVEIACSIDAHSGGDIIEVTL